MLLQQPRRTVKVRLTKEERRGRRDHKNIPEIKAEDLGTFYQETENS